ncbi:hypothetical protein E2C01_062015 [Portunus trituberculatus]|uniref:Uncharacterized protein n=1 Tax=Portunus trituberculatus TaxID=210409 RepID=A0A5B7HDE9_PORTR|nr:hypothetical protein [Portunus trituberculatus]
MHADGVAAMREGRHGRLPDRVRQHAYFRQFLPASLFCGYSSVSRRDALALQCQQWRHLECARPVIRLVLQRTRTLGFPK